MSEYFPANSEMVPESDITSTGTWKIKPCKACGATVSPSGEERHIAWHEAIGGLVENISTFTASFQKWLEGE